MSSAKEKLREAWLFATSPAKFLAMINIICAALSFITGIVTARILGPGLIGITAIILGVGNTINAFLDVRLPELAGKLYYKDDMETPEEKQRHRASVLVICVSFLGVQSLLLFLLTIGISLVAISHFTDSEVRLSWIIGAAFFVATTRWGNSFRFLLRFSNKFYLLGVWKLIGQLASMAILIPIIAVMRNIDGYFLGRVIYGAVNLLMFTSVTLYVWTRMQHLPIFRRDIFDKLPLYLKEYRFLIFGNLLGYAKMLHRGIDVLVVGRFCDDETTGVYRVARTLTDSLYLLFEAFNQVYFPKFLELMSKKMKSEYGRLVGRILRMVAVLTAGLFLGEWLVFPHLIAPVMSEKFVGVGLEMTVIIMTIPFFFVTGVQLWVWPMFVSGNRIGAFTVLTFVACIVQYAVILILNSIFTPSAFTGAAALSSHYLFLYPILALLAFKWFPDYLYIGKSDGGIS